MEPLNQARNRQGMTKILIDRDDFLEQAKELINGQRAKDYGDAKENHQKIASLWSAYLTCKRPDGSSYIHITPEDVVLMMMLVKVARITHSSTTDSWVDLCGYAALGGEFSHGLELAEVGDV
jgi:hypothetical protein